MSDKIRGLLKQAVMRKLAAPLPSKALQQPNLFKNLVGGAGVGTLGGAVGGSVFGGDALEGAKAGAILGAGAGGLRHALQKGLLGIRTRATPEQVRNYLRGQKAELEGLRRAGVEVDVPARMAKIRKREEAQNWFRRNLADYGREAVDIGTSPLLIGAVGAPLAAASAMQNKRTNAQYGLNR